MASKAAALTMAFIITLVLTTASLAEGKPSSSLQSASTPTAGPKCVNQFPEKPLCRFVNDLASRPIHVLDGTQPITLGVHQIFQKFHRDLPPSKQYAYGASSATAMYPGPMVVAKRGVETKVTWQNKLKDPRHMFQFDPTIMPDAKFPSTGIPISPHRHGGEQPSTVDGHPLAWFTQFGATGPTHTSAEYTYPNSQAPATLWIHDHALAHSALNTAAGMAALWVITDNEDAAEKAINKLVPASRTLPLVIADRSFFPNGSVFYPNVGILPTVHPNWVPGYIGNTTVVNGLVWPYLKVRPAMYRFKILGASNARFYNLSFACAARRDYPNFAPPLSGPVLPFTEVGSDNGYLPRPVQSTWLLLAPSERHDILVDFSQAAAAGCRDVIVVNSANAPYPWGPPPDASMGVVMRFKLTKQRRMAGGSVPGTLTYVPPIDYSKINKVRWHTLTFNIDPATQLPTRLAIDNKGYMDPVTDLPKQGSHELWYFVNPTIDAHPMHLHLTAFRGVGRRPINSTAFLSGSCSFKDKTKPSCFTGPREPMMPNEAGWKDSMILPPNYVLAIWVGWHAKDGSAYPFDATEGPGYVFHCHMMEHEANDMMRPFKLVK